MAQTSTENTAQPQPPSLEPHPTKSTINNNNNNNGTSGGGVLRKLLSHIHSDKHKHLSAETMALPFPTQIQPLVEKDLLREQRVRSKRADLRHDKCSAAVTSPKSSVVDHCQLAMETGSNEEFKRLLLSRKEWKPKHLHRLLFFAVECNNAEAVKTLLNDPNVDANALDHRQYTPLFRAAMHDSVDAAEVLIESGNADVNAINQRHKVSVLYVAAHNASSRVVSLLLKHGADVHFQRSSNGETVLEAAVASNSCGTVNAVLQNTSELKDDHIGMAAMHVRSARVMAVLLSFSESADHVLRMRRKDGGNIVHSLAEEGLIESLLHVLNVLPLSASQVLLNQGMDGLYGCTPLMLAVLCEQTAFIRVLCLMQEIDIDKQNRDGDTALHIAVKNRYLDAIHLLYHIGNASVNIKNKAKKTVKRLCKELSLNLDNFDTSQWEFASAPSSQKNGGRDREHSLRNSQEIQSSSSVSLGMKSSESSISHHHLQNHDEDVEDDVDLEQQQQQQQQQQCLPESDAPRLLDWTAQYELGEAELDDQHRVLFEVMNDLYEHLLLQKHDQRRQALLGYLIGRLVDYTHFHFSEEEKEMEDAKVPSKFLKLHRRKHREFVHKIEKAHRRYISGQREEMDIEIELLEYLRDWMKNHIMNDDRHFMEWQNVTTTNSKRSSSGSSEDDDEQQSSTEDESQSS